MPGQQVRIQRPCQQIHQQHRAPRALGKGWVLPVKLPLWAVRLTSVIAGKIGKMRMKPSTLNPDKYLIMAQRNWCADTSEARRDFGFKARVDLAEGIRRTVEAYRKPGSK